MRERDSGERTKEGDVARPSHESMRRWEPAEIGRKRVTLQELWRPRMRARDSGERTKESDVARPSHDSMRGGSQL